jgi:hypothetical protein
MAAEYYILVRSPAGVKQAVIDDFLEIAYSKRIWEPGLLSVKMLGGSSNAQYFVNNAQVEVWRRNIDFGIDWYIDFYGLYRKEEYETPAETDYFTASCPGQMTILSWATNLYPDREEGYSIFTGQPSETIMKKMVTNNLTSAALVANGRAVDWPYATLQQQVTVETDLGRGNTLDWKCLNINLLSSLQDLATISGGDFDLIKTGGSTWDFRFYPGQRGTDRTASVTFSLALGNMSSPSYIYDRISEATIAIVGGRGDAATRDYVAVTGTGYDTTNNYIETFVHASNNDTDAYLVARGQEYLYSVLARKKLSFIALQTPAVQYGRDYFLGDLITAFYRGSSFIQKVFGVSIGYRPGEDNPESISIEMRDN